MFFASPACGCPSNCVGLRGNVLDRPARGEFRALLSCDNLTLSVQQRSMMTMCVESSLCWVPCIGCFRAFRISFPGTCLALAILASTAASARASCGDWLAHASNNGQAADGAVTGDGDADSSGSSDFDTREVAPSDGPTPLPCDGPHCSRAPETPAPPAPPVTAPTSKDDGGRTGNGTCMTTAAAGILTSDLSLRVFSGHARRIDRPPRV